MLLDLRLEANCIVIEVDASEAAYRHGTRNLLEMGI